MFWMSAFLDFAPEHFVAGTSFWRRVTGCSLSSARGDNDEFATLIPPDGDDYLRVQRLGSGANRIHLDLHVPDLDLAADAAETSGASVVERHDGWYVEMTSPGGFPFCFVTDRASRRPAPVRWPEGQLSAVDQVCLEIPSARYAVECAFWEGLTGWELRPSDTHPQFQRLVRPTDQPLHLMLQRIEQPLGRVGAHLDLATTQRALETQRHVALGASFRGLYDDWTVLVDPAGSEYCITDRRP